MVNTCLSFYWMHYDKPCYVNDLKIHHKTSTIFRCANSWHKMNNISGMITQMTTRDDYLSGVSDIRNIEQRFAQHRTIIDRIHKVVNEIRNNKMVRVNDIGVAVTCLRKQLICQRFTSDDSQWQERNSAVMKPITLLWRDTEYNKEKSQCQIK